MKRMVRVRCLTRLREVNKSRRGFTIIEVLIVLAVSSALFLIAFYEISGRQNQAEFQQGINQIESQIQQSIDQVAAGDYLTSGSYVCTGNSSTATVTITSTGTNDGCIFLGKVLQFGVQGTDPEQFIAYDIMGVQQDTLGNETSSLRHAVPTAAAIGTVPNASTSKTLSYGIKAYSMKYINGAVTKNIGAVGFIGSLASYNGSNLNSGSQQVNLYPIDGTHVQQASTQTVGKINSNLANATENPSGGVEICFASGTTNQSGLITIGSNGRSLSVTLQIKYDTTC